MTDLVFRVVLKADGSGLVGQTRLSREEVERLTVAAGNAGAGLGKLGAGAQAAAGQAGALAAESSQASAAVTAVGQSATAAQGAVLSLAVVEQKLEAILQATIAQTTRSASANDQLASGLAAVAAAGKIAETAQLGLGQAERAAEQGAEQLSGELTRLSAAARAAAGAQAGAAAAMGASAGQGRKNAEATRQQSAGMQQFGYQVGDFTQQAIAASQSSNVLKGVVIAFTQQAGQAAGALALMGGAAGKVGAYLSGPLGAIILGTVSVVALLSANLLGAGDATDDLSSRQSALASYLDRTTGKVKEQISYLALLANAQEVAKKQAEARANYDKSRERLLRAGAAATAPNYVADPTAIAAPAVLPADITGKGAAKVKQFFADYAAGVGNVTDLTKRLQAAAAEGLIPPAALRTLTTAAIAVDANAAANNTLVVQLARVAVAAGTATAAQRSIVTANTEATASGARHLENLGELAAATTNLEKARIRLRIVQERSSAAEKAGGAVLQQYGRDYAAAAAGVAKAEKAEEGARKGKTASAAASRQLARDTRDADRAANEFAAYNDKLASSLDQLLRKIAPTAAALRDYAKQLALIQELGGSGSEGVYEGRFTFTEEGASLRSGRIDQGAELQLNNQARAEYIDAVSKATADAVAKIYSDNGVDAVGDLAKISEAHDNVSEAAAGLTDSLGTMGDAVDIIASNLARVFGTGAGSVIGGLLDAVTGARQGQYDQFGAAIEKVAKQVGINPDNISILGKSLGKSFGDGLAGADAGASINALDKQLGISKTLGLKSSKTGAEIGGAIGSLVPIPGGQIIGSVIGSVVGGAFKKTKSGAVNLTSADGEGAVSGNSSAAKKAASGLAGSVQASLNSIAEQLGATLGSFNVTVGQRHGDYRVTTGTSLKVNKGAQDFNDDADAANAAAVRIAITQGAIAGLSAAMQKAIQSNADIDKALSEVLKVKDLEELIAGVGGTLLGTFKTFETTAADRLRVAKAYGVDLVKVEQVNAEQRASVFNQVMSDQLASVQSLLADLSFGDLSEGSLSDQRTKILAEITKLQPDAEAGKEGAADKLTDLQRRLLSVSKEGFGTAGPEYATDRASTIASLERVQQLETDRVNAAQEQARRLTSAAEKSNGLIDEGNDLAAVANAELAGIRAALAGLSTQLGTGTGLASDSLAYALTGRQVSL